MKKETTCNYYPPLEEKLNIFSHGFGFALSIVGLILLIFRANELGEVRHLVSFSIFGASMIILYAASTLYHSAKSDKWRYRLNILDHASIYLLIAGTYTPFAIVTLSGTLGWGLFALVWTMAIVGVILKIFYTGRYTRISTVMYVIMGWIIVFAVKPMLGNIDMEGIGWLFAGGVSYTLGAVFFSIDKIKFNHAIFHLLVLIGSFCHFIAIYFYVLPEKILQ